MSVAYEDGERTGGSVQLVVSSRSGVSAVDERVTVEQDIKPLFRPVDHESMAWAFDLSSYDDVKEHATAILERLRDCSMPCDGEWPEAQVARFQRWTETGMLE